MRSFQFFLPVFILALLLQCQGVPMEDFFTTDGLSGGMFEPVHFPTLSTSCEQVQRLDVSVVGTANLSSPSAPQITVTPFLVTSTDLNDDSSFFLQSDFLNSLQNVSELENLYKEYYPRNEKERPLKITRMMTITWELSNAAQMSKFQVVAAFNETKNAIFVLYQYQDGTMQLSSADSKVELRICDDEWTYDNPSNIFTETNVKEPGRYAFLYNDSGINPAVICTEGCSVSNGYCIAEDECKCLSGWMGPTCTDVACQAECLINGRCDTANVCTCNSAKWSGTLCNVPRCIGCINGMCIVPDNCECNHGWDGDNCTIPLCPAGCGNGQCMGPEMCQCNGGWSGDRCMVPMCDACVNGQCTLPATCECDHPGWSGAACDVANCSAECMINGYCEVPNNCTCDEGWIGVVCEEPICLEGCSNGFCELPGQCNCTEDYIGELCDSTPEPPVLSPTEIGLLTGGLVVFVIICAVVVASVLLAIRFC